MARKSRLHVPAGMYHVILRGDARQDVFFSPVDRTLFYRLPAERLPQAHGKGTRRFSTCLSCPDRFSVDRGHASVASAPLDAPSGTQMLLLRKGVTSRHGGAIRPVAPADHHVVPGAGIDPVRAAVCHRDGLGAVDGKSMGVSLH